jgi:hypothetical protein
MDHLGAPNPNLTFNAEVQRDQLRAPPPSPASGSEGSFQELDPAPAAELRANEDIAAARIGGGTTAPIGDDKGKKPAQEWVGDEILDIDSDGEDDLSSEKSSNESSSLSPTRGPGQVGNAAAAPPAVAPAALPAPAAPAPALAAAPAPPAPALPAPAGAGLGGGPLMTTGQMVMGAGAISMIAGTFTAMGSGFASSAGVSAGAAAGFVIGGVLLLGGLVGCIYGMRYRPPVPAVGAQPR